MIKKISGTPKLLLLSEFVYEYCNLSNPRTHFLLTWSVIAFDIDGFALTIFAVFICPQRRNYFIRFMSNRFLDTNPQTKKVIPFFIVSVFKGSFLIVVSSKKLQIILDLFVLYLDKVCLKEKVVSIVECPGR